ncbi:MAG: hypothetical protein KKB37_16155, partial [Alphaproteobacteria bacterium]|nr:hypothetical protein [Alphaproteobacteria bacterium]
LGLWRTLGFHAVFAGFLVSVLAYPLMYVLLALELARPEPFATEPGSVHHLALTVAVLDAMAGAVAAMMMTGIGAVRAGLGSLGWYVLAQPLYWLLVSRAGYRALVQIVWRPHLWEKTEHTARRGRR